MKLALLFQNTNIDTRIVSRMRTVRKVKGMMITEARVLVTESEVARGYSEGVSAPESAVTQ